MIQPFYERVSDMKNYKYNSLLAKKFLFFGDDGIASRT